PTATVTFNVTDFTVTASPTNVNYGPGSSGASTITVATVNGFTGTVALTSSVSPAGPTCTLSPASIVLGASQTSTLSCTSGTPISFTATVTGTSGTLSHSATVTFTPTDFTIAASPTAVPTTAARLSVNCARAAASTSTVAPGNGLAGTVALTTSAAPA